MIPKGYSFDDLREAVEHIKYMFSPTPEVRVERPDYMHEGRIVFGGRVAVELSPPDEDGLPRYYVSAVSSSEEIGVFAYPRTMEEALRRLVSAYALYRCEGLIAGVGEAEADPEDGARAPST